MNIKQCNSCDTFYLNWSKPSFVLRRKIIKYSYIVLYLNRIFLFVVLIQRNSKNHLFLMEPEKRCCLDEIKYIHPYSMHIYSYFLEFFKDQNHEIMRFEVYVENMQNIHAFFTWNHHRSCNTRVTTSVSIPIKIVLHKITNCPILGSLKAFSMQYTNAIWKKVN